MVLHFHQINYLLLLQLFLRKTVDVIKRKNYSKKCIFQTMVELIRLNEPTKAFVLVKSLRKMLYILPFFQIVPQYISRFVYIFRN